MFYLRITTVYFIIVLLLCTTENIIGWNKPETSRQSLKHTLLKRAKFLTSITGFVATSKVKSAFASSFFEKIKSTDVSKKIQSIFLDNSSFLSERAYSADAGSYEPGVKSSDVFYPAEFLGKWNVTSTFTDCCAPLGVEVFGGQTAFDSVQKDVNSTLNYLAIFKNGSNGTIIADRLYNVEHIAEASMGKNSILNDAQLDGDLAKRLRLTISPPTSKGAIFDIELLTTDRQSSLQPSVSVPNPSDLSSSITTPLRFEAMERTSQVIRVRAEKDDKPTLPLRKNIETITLYLVVDKDTIRGVQRTATYLSPYDPRYGVAYSRNPAVAKTAVDIRRYEMLYKRV